MTTPGEKAERETSRFRRPNIVKIGNEYQRRTWNKKAQEWDYTLITVTPTTCSDCGDEKLHHRGGLGLCMHCTCSQFRRIIKIA